MGNSWIIAILVATECSDVGLNTLAKAATRQGMSEFVFVVYSSAMALLILLPSTFVFHIVRPCPQLTFSIVCRIFVLGLLGCTVQICMYVGIGYSSPTLASVITDLTPAFTFILAIITRMEKLELKVPSSQAKSIGTIISITGALIVTLYKGPSILFSQSDSKLLYEPFLMPQWNWIFGGILCTVAIFFLALLFIVKAWIIKDYPAELMVTLISCFFETMQSAIVALVAERDPNAWKLRPNLELVTIFYSAILAVSFRNVVQAWALRKKGPVFVAMFKPLDMFIAAVMGITFLGDALYIGSVIGAAIIAVGFYSVMWGKAKEEKDVKDHEICSFDESSDRIPLLQNTSVHV